MEADADFFDFDPGDFEIADIGASWRQPCWICVAIVFRASSDRSKAAFPLPMRLDFLVDLFASQLAPEQLRQQVFSNCGNLLTAGHSAWSEFSSQHLRELEAALADTSRLFNAPFRLVERWEFERVDLASVLRCDPDGMVAYLADDTDSYGREILVLRIHSSLWWYDAATPYLLFQKKVPANLRSEDLIPWFEALVHKLPRKRQPLDLSRWISKILECDPQLEQPSDNVMLIFGPREQIGFASLFHIERQSIQMLIRRRQQLSFHALVENRYERDPSKLIWAFYLFCPSPAHAKRLQERLLSGQQSHFGIGDDISAMIAAGTTLVQAVNVPFETVEKLCGRDGMMLDRISAPRFRQQTYVFHAL